MQVFFAYIFGIIILIVLAKILLWPLKILIKVLVNALAGGIALFLINLVGIHISINIFTALITGVLGIPGIVLILLLQNIL